VSGKVVAFGGRTLKKDVAKYVNSPESAIYHKSNTLYGMYQAKPAIVRHDKCILVEGYMDVISMHQSGVENVVASSGTSLTDGQIRMIHRFTNNVTVIYDGDAAGIKASLRGIDMLLAEGLNIKVLLLPDGDDPDSFARKHSSSELEAYLKDNEVDFIQFKTNILLQGAENDPISRSKVINDIVRSIAVIPNPVDRNIYIKECSRRLDIDERIINLEVTKQAKAISESNQLKAKQQEARESLKQEPQQQQPQPEEQTPTEYQGTIYIERHKGNEAFLRPYEKEVLKYAIRYGMVEFCDDVDAEGNTMPMNVLGFIMNQLKFNDLKFENKDIMAVLNEAVNISKQTWTEDLERNDQRLLSERATYISQGEESIRANAADISEIERAEKNLITTADERYNAARRQFATMYIAKALSSHPDEKIRLLTLELVSDKHVLSKVHTKYAHIDTDDERLAELVPRAIYQYEDAILECRIRSVNEEIKQAYTSSQDQAKVIDLMKDLAELQRLRGDFAKYLGERIINPRK
jgi:DNA primase